MIIARTALRTTLVSLALLLVTFVGGLLAGAAVERTVGSPGEPLLVRAPRAAPSPPRDVRPSRFLDQLDLTEEQHAEIERVLERGRAQTKAFWESEGARLREIVEETRSDIRAVLTPEQEERFEELRARRGGAHRGGPHDSRRSPPRR